MIARLRDTTPLIVLYIPKGQSIATTRQEIVFAGDLPMWSVEHIQHGDIILRVTFSVSPSEITDG